MVEIKVAVLEQLEEIYQLMLELQAYYGRQLSKNEAKEEGVKLKLALEEKLLFVALSDSKSVGYLLVRLLDKTHPHFPNSIFLDELFVKEEFRRQGIGERLVEFALKQDYPPEYQYFSVTHSPKEPWLTKFYESLGFEQEGMTEVGNIKLTKKK
ncbi:MAG TPA: GNAT family N-acetyltransferase [Patescibacteria group bacterium]|nr:GNAT family N-acetyltransferase [Patescibacteria group bacterium]